VDLLMLWLLTRNIFELSLMNITFLNIRISFISLKMIKGIPEYRQKSSIFRSRAYNSIYQLVGLKEIHSI